MDTASAWRLILALSAAGVLLLALEVFMTGMALWVFGVTALLGSVGLAYYSCGIDVGSVLLLIHTTVLSIGSLLMLVYFPRSPLALRRRRAAEKRAAEEEASQSEEL